MIGKLITAALVGYLSVTFIRTSYRNRDRVVEAYSNISLQLFVYGILALSSVAFTAYVLITNFPSVMGASWLNLFGSSGTNINAVGIYIPFFGIIFCLLLMAALPVLAYWEEELFRKGTKNWKGGFARSVIFGLAHMLVGVPLGAGLALTIAGLYFTYMYFKGGIELATQAHFQYNLIAVSILLLISISSTTG